jgi:hypothetical protein
MGKNIVVKHQKAWEWENVDYATKTKYIFWLRLKG